MFSADFEARLFLIVTGHHMINVMRTDVEMINPQNCSVMALTCRPCCGH